MGRLIIKNENTDFFTGVKFEYETDDLYAIDKLGKLEDLEDQLGFALIPVLTALANGYAFWKEDNFIYKVQVVSISNCCLKVNAWYYANYNKNNERYGDEFSISLKNYGKTWWLEKPKENEK